jgi:ribosomal protein S18 acetylase RimI-like enzyme
MESKIVIRKARISDVNKIYSLGMKTKELRFSKKFGFHGKDEIKEYSKNKNGNILLVALYKNKFAGFLFAKIVDKDWCILDNIAIDKKYRQHGIGSELIEYLSKMLKNKGMDYVQCLVDSKNKKLRNFWKGKGFKEEKVFVWVDKEV